MLLTFTKATGCDDLHDLVKGSHRDGRGDEEWVDGDEVGAMMSQSSRGSWVGPL